MVRQRVGRRAVVAAAMGVGMAVLGMWMAGGGVGVARAGQAAPAGAEVVKAGKKFTLFIYETPEQQALRGDRTPAGGAYWASFAAYGKVLQEAGVMRGGSPLEPQSAVRVVRVVDGKRAVTEGVHAAASGGQVLGGYFVIEVPDLAAALEWAAKAPNATTGAVEVRPVLDVPGM